MTQVLPRRTQPAPPPLLPHTVVVQALRDGRDVLHLPGCGHARRGFVATTDAMRRVQPSWCGVCWPGGRCGVCREPSGDWNECDACYRDDTADEAAYDRAVEYQEV